MSHTVYKNRTRALQEAWLQPILHDLSEAALFSLDRSKFVLDPLLETVRILPLLLVQNHHFEQHLLW